MSEYIYERPEQPAKVIRDGWNVRIEWDFVQREEIVRCRDCKHYEYCRFHANRPDKPDGFCAWGERKGDAE